MTHLSLFSGIGGIDLAAHWAGFETIQFVERDPFCQRVLTKNFKGVPIHDDVTTFDGRPFAGRTDLISAGFPCQPHSLAGKRMASGDERDLWGEVVRILGETKPKWFLGENVPGLFSSESGRFFGRVVDDLASLGFSVGWCCYGASDVGAVHRRNRVFIVAYSQEQFGNGGDDQSSGAPVPKSGNNDCSGDATYSPSVRRPDIQESRFNRQDDKERKKGGAKQFEGSGVSQDATDSENVSGSQTFEATMPERSQRNSQDYLSGGDWGCLGRGDWRGWSVEPVLRAEDDGVPDRVARLKALGNAVCPQQIYPVLKAIAEASQ
jgi:DNA (cytosine-5)-methyltransferase 1